MGLDPRHDGHGDMDMGSMGTTSGVPGYFYMQKMYWVVIGSVIAFAALLNLLDNILLWQRQQSLNAKPKFFLASLYATVTALGRETNSASLPTYRLGWLTLRSPPSGKLIVVLSYLVTITVMCLYMYDTGDQWSWEDIAYRCGCIAQAQLPLIFLLAGKQNIIGCLTGMSYERLNWLHRWVARILWLTATFHLMFWFRSWARYDYIRVKLSTDRLTQTGFASWCILTAIVAFSFAPIRRFNYEVFVISHLVLFAGLIGSIYTHVTYGKTYIWFCVGIFFLDRTARLAVAAVANLSFLHRRSPGRHWLWANRATLTPLPGNITRITIDKPVLKWSPGQHVFLSCHTVVPLQSHPFTIASLPCDEKLEFLVQARRGGTKRFHRFASKSRLLPNSGSAPSYQRVANDEPSLVGHKLVGMEGPYGRIRPLRQFDSIVFLAGSTGATFTVPLMRDIIQRWKDNVGGSKAIVTRKIRFVWVIKARDRLCWFQEQLENALSDVANIRTSEGHLNKDLDLSIYITCDEELDASKASVPCEPSEHGPAEIASAAVFHGEEKYQLGLDEKVEVQSLGSNGDAAADASRGCCCKKAANEDAAPMSCCCVRPTSSSDDSISSSVNEKGGKSSALEPHSAHTGLKLVSGRPKPRSLIRKVLEEAEGESAVVVCGPQGLQDDVRRSVVALSDERAVHKGTGAQGIFLHVEGFCY
ncbi:uncharacterized protein A1O9_03504 [Exophiala aquamarina CBS 119918]|uniref:ferric-chelate reductase (NADPH) n=1 Tax=Exophiala aquamarina CBS 119918 TaxID=1182545 RepID=A0A072PQB4_9EURO|nr:uncharacterized protein A1O9_03504 [Exophiala aquamarina CBS 119918]KEF61932.1 hypothetical protein A1O9_03504 [Exophiala aquamarina CBS 119918]